jgi:ADP-ribose pyrophosphatase YjhB (NUDIX family)
MNIGPLRDFFRREPERWTSAAGVMFRDDHVLLIRQLAKWTFPGGRVDIGEDLDAAARREVHEETGLRATVGEYLGVVEHTRHDTHYFLMTFVADEGRRDFEVDEMRFVTPDEAIKLLSRRLRPVLRCALDARAGRPPQDSRIVDEE